MSGTTRPDTTDAVELRADLVELAAALPTIDDVIGLRRDLHAHPELGFTEVRTAARVLGELTTAGWDVTFGAAAGDASAHPGLPPRELLDSAVERGVTAGMSERLARCLSDGNTAVVADLDGDGPGPRIAIRFDMDALPILESTADDHAPAVDGHASTQPGVMHACGHDGHVAIGIALARRLADRRFPGHVRLLFQPAEEGVRGAHGMVEAGWVDDVDTFLAIHLGLGLPTRTIAAGTSGRLATRKLLARFHGRASHAAASPESGRNTLLAAASAALAVQALPRFSTADTRVNVGRLVAGTATNIVAADAELAYEVRSTDSDVVAELDRRAAAICAGAAAMQEVEHTIVETGRAGSAPSDDAVVERVATVARATEGVREVWLDRPGLGSDDATLFMERVQGLGGNASYVGFGSGDIAPHHSDHFDIDESALSIAVDVLEAVVRSA